MMYKIVKTDQVPDLTQSFDSKIWSRAEIGMVTFFFPESSEHHPVIRFRMVYHDKGIYLKFNAQDRYVLARCTTFQGYTCNDSCVECLLQPSGGIGYVSFEMNCIGTLLSYHITDPRRGGKMFEKFRELSREELQDLRIETTLGHHIIEPEINQEVSYEVSVFIPFPLLTQITGAPLPHAGTLWQGNFFKCADQSSHPHWGAWNPMGKELNFHQPQYFGNLEFQ